MPAVRHHSQPPPVYSPRNHSDNVRGQRRPFQRGQRSSASMRVPRSQPRARIDQRPWHEEPIYHRRRSVQQPSVRHSPSRGRRIRPEITIISVAPMAEHPAFADGNKGAYIPPEAPPSYEQAMRTPAESDSSTSANVSRRESNSEIHQIFPVRHIVNSDAISVPSYSESIAPQSTTTVTSSAATPISRGLNSSSSQPSTSPLFTSSRVSSSQSDPSFVRSRNVNHSNNIVERRDVRPTESSQVLHSRLEIRLRQRIPPARPPKPSLPPNRPALKPKPKPRKLPKKPSHRASSPTHRSESTASDRSKPEQQTIDSGNNSHKIEIPSVFKVSSRTTRQSNNSSNISNEANHFTQHSQRTSVNCNNNSNKTSEPSLSRSANTPTSEAKMSTTNQNFSSMNGSMQSASMTAPFSPMSQNSAQSAQMTNYPNFDGLFAPPQGGTKPLVMQNPAASSNYSNLDGMFSSLQQDQDQQPSVFSSQSGTSASVFMKPPDNQLGAPSQPNVFPSTNGSNIANQPHWMNDAVKPNLMNNQGGVNHVQMPVSMQPSTAANLATTNNPMSMQGNGMEVRGQQNQARLTQNMMATDAAPMQSPFANANSATYNPIQPFHMAPNAAPMRPTQGPVINASSAGSNPMQTFHMAPNAAPRRPSQGPLANSNTAAFKPNQPINTDLSAVPMAPTHGPFSHPMAPGTAPIRPSQGPSGNLKAATPNPMQQLPLGVGPSPMQRTVNTGANIATANAGVAPMRPSQTPIVNPNIVSNPTQLTSPATNSARPSQSNSTAGLLLQPSQMDLSNPSAITASPMQPSQNLFSNPNRFPSGSMQPTVSQPTETSIFNSNFPANNEMHSSPNLNLTVSGRSSAQPGPQTMMQGNQRVSGADLHALAQPSKAGKPQMPPKTYMNQGNAGIPPSHFPHSQNQVPTQQNSMHGLPTVNQSTSESFNFQMQHTKFGPSSLSTPSGQMMSSSSSGQSSQMDMFFQSEMKKSEPATLQPTQLPAQNFTTSGINHSQPIPNAVGPDIFGNMPQSKPVQNGAQKKKPPPRPSSGPKRKPSVKPSMAPPPRPTARQPSLIDLSPMKPPPPTKPPSFLGNEGGAALNSESNSSTAPSLMEDPYSTIGSSQAMIQPSLLGADLNAPNSQALRPLPSDLNSASQMSPLFDPVNVEMTGAKENDDAEPVYAALKKKSMKELVRSSNSHEKLPSVTDGTPAPTPTPEFNNAQLKSDKTEMSPPPLPASRPPLEDFEDLFTPSEMNKAMAEREKNTGISRTIGEDTSESFGITDSPTQEDPYQSFGEDLMGELPRVKQTTAPPVLPAPRKKKGGQKQTPPPLPKSNPKSPEPNSVIYSKPVDGTSPEATLIGGQKIDDSQKNFTKKLRKKSMKFKQSTMNLFKSNKESDSKTEDSETQQKAGATTAKVKPIKTPPARPTSLPQKPQTNSAIDDLISLQPSLTPATTNIPAMSPQAPQMTPSPITPQSIQPMQKAKPEKPPPPKTAPARPTVAPSRPAPTPSRAAPTRPPLKCNTNQNNHINLETPTPKPRSNSKPDAPEPVPKGRTVAPARAAPPNPLPKRAPPTAPGTRKYGNLRPPPAPKPATRAHPPNKASNQSQKSTQSSESGSKVTVTAMFDFPGAADDELVFKAGDVINDVTEVNQDWSKGWLRGKCGIFPKGFVSVNKQKQQSGLPSSNAAIDNYPTSWDDEPSALPSLDQSPSTNKEEDPPVDVVGGTSVHQEETKDSSDWPVSSSLEMTDGPSPTQDTPSPSDPATLTEPSDNKPSDETAEPSPIKTDNVAVSQKGKSRIGVAMYAFDGQDDAELSFAVGDSIEIIGEVNEDWLTGRLQSGKEGMFPAAYVTFDAAPTLSTDSVVASSAETEYAQPVQNTSLSPSSGFVEPMATGKMNYDAATDEEISFKVGDVLYLLEQVDAEWLMVQHGDTSAVGNVPLSHIDIIHPLP